MENKPKRTKKPRVAKIIGGIVLLALLALAGSSVVWYQLNLRPVSTLDNATQEFAVSEGSTTAQIAQNLEDKGLIRNALAFRIYHRLEAKDKNLKAGSYYFSGDMSVAQIIEQLNKGADAKVFRLTFLPGGSLAAARERLQRVGYSEDEINAAFTKQYDHVLLASRPADVTTLEGFIYGDTYEFYVGATVSDILTATFDKMYADIQANQLEEAFRNQGLSLYQGIVLSSIVQGEAGSLSGDMPKVAQVFYNRLANNIPLGSDIVIGYYADQHNPNRDKRDMSYLNTTPCPWHSRRCTGLPPNPVNNPGLSALKAVAHPDQAYQGYYYFLTGDDGAMYYAKTEAEHEANKRHCPKLCGIL
ncbi:endolytic transglycosylase MltG [Candidatus Saccharibacteria bacterium]|nr:endolytic transglycosylase MltG [Candidatus Saccharibacteria bacterium]